MEVRADFTSTLDAATYYRDELGWAVHPLAGPREGKLNERGKKPLLAGYKNWTKEKATDEFLNQYFGSGCTCNLGIIVRPPHVVVDLDSKQNQGKSVSRWLDGQGHLADVPRECTTNGCHLHFRCHLPRFINQNGQDYNKALSQQINESVTAELYFNGQNIVVSPSVHPSGVCYQWEVTGDIPEITWKQLQEWFGFQLPNSPVENGKTGAARPGRPRKEPPWWTRIKVT
jgi:hypothetical protein